MWMKFKIFLLKIELLAECIWTLMEVENFQIFMWFSAISNNLTVDYLSNKWCLTLPLKGYTFCYIWSWLHNSLHSSINSKTFHAILLFIYLFFDDICCHFFNVVIPFPQISWVYKKLVLLDILKFFYWRFCICWKGTYICSELA